MIAAPAIAAADPESLRPAVTTHGWQLELTGYVQVDAVASSDASVDEIDASGQPLNEERFLIRRGRLRAEAHQGALSGALEFDGNTQSGATARLLGAQVGWHLPAEHGPPLVAITAGLFKIPFGAEVPASERDKAFLEPPAFARALFPGNYDAGVMAQGGYGIARWSIAMMNGVPVGDAQWKGKDPTSSYDLVGRVGAEISGPRQLRVEVGVSAITGKGLHPGTPATKDELQWVDENQDGLVQTTELRVIPGMTGLPSQTFDHDAIGGDVQVHWCLCRLGHGTAFAEAVLATNLDRATVTADPVAASRDFRELGVSAGVVQEVGDHAQVGVRYDRYEADRDAMERLGTEFVGIDKVFSTISVMAAGRWHDARLLVQLDHETNPFGRGDNGEAVTRRADRLTFRAQVGF